jgi:hypothetical protein
MYCSADDDDDDDDEEEEEEKMEDDDETYVDHRLATYKLCCTSRL